MQKTKFYNKYDSPTQNLQYCHSRFELKTSLDYQINETFNNISVCHVTQSLHTYEALSCDIRWPG